MDAPAIVLDERPYYARSPFQVALLSFCTLGVYILWWSYHTRRSTATLLDQPDNPFWMSAALVVPFFNLWVLYDLLEKLKVLGLRARLHVSIGLFVAGLLWLALALFGRLPAALGAPSLLSFLPLAYMQTFVTRSEFVLSDRTISPKRFTRLEVLVVVLGSVLNLFVFVGMLTEQHAGTVRWSPYWPFVATIEALALAGLVFAYLKGRDVIALQGG
jgi:hypothetical protein